MYKCAVHFTVYCVHVLQKFLFYVRSVQKGNIVVFRSSSDSSKHVIQSVVYCLYVGIHFLPVLDGTTGIHKTLDNLDRQFINVLRHNRQFQTNLILLWYLAGFNVFWSCFFYWRTVVWI